MGPVASYGVAGAAAYGPSKAAVLTLAEVLAPDLARKGVRVSVINPGYVSNPMTAPNDFPMPYIVSVETAADHIVRGLERGRFEIAFPWQTVAHRSWRVLPYPLYFWFARTFLMPSREREWRKKNLAPPATLTRPLPRLRNLNRRWPYSFSPNSTEPPALSKQGVFHDFDHVQRRSVMTCLTSVGVFLTAMNLAAANAMTLRSPPSCATPAAPSPAGRIRARRSSARPVWRAWPAHSEERATTLLGGGRPPHEQTRLLPSLP